KANLSISQVDSLTGPLIGRPKSATFRTLDVVGLDTFISVANNVHEQVTGDEQKVFEILGFMNKMAEKGWLGAKTGKGFFEKRRGEKGSEILELNPDTFEYEPRKRLKTAATEMAGQQKGPGNKIKTLISQKGDEASDFVWSIIKPVLIYSAELVGEIADDILAIDQAMKWGFGWTMGPFEIWDAIGIKKSVERMQAEGDTLPQWIVDLAKEENPAFYRVTEDKVEYLVDGKYKDQVFNDKEIDLKRLKAKNGVIKKNSGASLIDLGDGVLVLEFHSHSNALGLDSIQMINFAIEEIGKNPNYKGLVLGNQGSNFCVGANIGLMLMEAQDDNFFELDMVIKQFQNMAMNIKYSEKPVVTAPFQMSVGGGAEVTLPAAAVQASQEAYIGLVEVGVGLIPGGGGTKELYLK